MGEQIVRSPISHLDNLSESLAHKRRNFNVFACKDYRLLHLEEYEQESTDITQIKERQRAEVLI